MFTKADFELVAKTIKGHAWVDPQSRLTLRNLANDFADEFAASSPRFDRDKFIKACGLEES